MINAKLKDMLLTSLIDAIKTPQVMRFHPKELIDALGIDFNTLNMMLIQFNKLHIISLHDARHTTIALSINVEAHDLLRRGGFQVQEELIAGNLEKLLLEIESLKKQIEPNHLEKVEKISTIATGVLATIKLYLGA